MAARMVNDFTSATCSSGDLSAYVRRGDAVRPVPDTGNMGTKVVVRVHATWLEVRPVRWYDHVRWFVQRTAARAQAAVLRLFTRAAP